MAQAPDTWGVAIEVPPNSSNPPPGIEEFMSTPGARMDRKDALFEKDAT
jgi:hypothetical protein